MSENLPRFLCYIDGDGAREAAIVNTKAEIITCMTEWWFGSAPGAISDRDDEWEPFLEDLAVRPDEWGDGVKQILWDFEGGYMKVTLLGDDWHEDWKWE